MKRALLRFLLVTALAASLVACSSSTMIQSNVPAKVYLNGEYVGQTPYVMSDTKIVGSSTQVRLEAPGYEQAMGVITRNEQFSVSACIGGVFLLVPFLWIMEYKPTHTFELRPLAGQPGAPAQDGWGAPPASGPPGY